MRKTNWTTRSIATPWFPLKLDWSVRWQQSWCLTKMFKQAKKGKKQRQNQSSWAQPRVYRLWFWSQSIKSCIGHWRHNRAHAGNTKTTEVIGKSKSDILDKMKVNVENQKSTSSRRRQLCHGSMHWNHLADKGIWCRPRKAFAHHQQPKLVLLSTDATQRNRNPENKEIKDFPRFRWRELV